MAEAGAGPRVRGRSRAGEEMAQRGSAASMRLSGGAAPRVGHAVPPPRGDPKRRRSGSSKIETASSGTGRVKYSVGENVDSDRQSVERGFGLCARARDGQMGLSQSSYDLSQFPLQSS